MNIFDEAFGACFPFWKGLREEDRSMVLSATTQVAVAKGTNIFSHNDAYNGVFLIKEGLIRVYITNGAGRDITVYRLNAGEIGILSSDAALHDIIFDMDVEAEEACILYFIPIDAYRRLSELLEVRLFTAELTISRYSEILWTMQQILFTSFDKRLAAFLVDETVRTKSDVINLTHERIASHTASAREVVSRMLKYFASEGLIETSRGSIVILDKKRLRALAQ